MSELEQEQEQEQEEEQKEEEEVVTEDEATKTKPVAQTPQTDSRFTNFWSSLTEKANTTSQANFEQMIVVDEYQYNGTTYKARMLTYDEKHELAGLQEKARTLSEKENWQEWKENQMKRACLLIEDMTSERFEKENAYILETIVAAWGLKPEGFRDLFQST